MMAKQTYFSYATIGFICGILSSSSHIGLLIGLKHPISGGFFNSLLLFGGFFLFLLPGVIKKYNIFNLLNTMLFSLPCGFLFLLLPSITQEILVGHIHYKRIPWIDLPNQWHGYLLSMIGMSYIGLFWCSYTSGHRLLKLMSPWVGAGIILLLSKFIYNNIPSCKTMFYLGENYQAITSSAEFFIILSAGPIMGLFTWGFLDFFHEPKQKSDYDRVEEADTLIAGKDTSPPRQDRGPNENDEFNRTD